jgi:hypothetical protein
VCVEAKAGESLGETVAEQGKRAQRAKRENEKSKASARLDHLIGRLCRYPTDDARVGALRYQLPTGWAATLSDAGGTAHEVFALHEFRTDERPEHRSAQNRDELDRFADAVLGCDLPQHVGRRGAHVYPTYKELTPASTLRTWSPTCVETICSGRRASPTTGLAASSPTRPRSSGCCIGLISSRSRSRGPGCRRRPYG